MTKAFHLRVALALVLIAAPPWAAAQAQAQAQNQPQTLAKPAGDEQFTLNFKDADITALIATVSEITSKNFVVDPRVKGQVTVLSSRPMSPDELYETFLSVLEVHGFSAVHAGEVTKIIPQVNAKQDGGFGRQTVTNEDIVTRVLQVKNVPADQLVPILRPLIPQYGHLAAYPASNILIISDREANVERLAKIVKQIDKQGNSEIERVQLENANAEEVVKTLTQLKTDSAKRSPTSANFTVLADERTNSVLISGDPAQRLRLRGVIADLDTPVKQLGGTQVIYLNYANAEDVAPALQSFAGGAASAQGGSKAAVSSGGGVSIVPESGANALVVTAPADVMREIRKVIEQLDIRRGQVLVEAIIAEISIDRSRQLGVDVGAFGKDGPAAASILNPSTLQAIPSLAMDGTPLGLIQNGINLAAGKLSNSGTSFAVLVRALSGDANTNVLSTPSIITRDNEEAEITVAQEVPFITGNFTNTGSNSGGGQVNPFQTVERRDVGLILGITPQINAGDTILLDINQEISSIANSSAGAVDLVTNKRTIKTSVEVEDGQILVLGGLIDDKVNETVQRIPLLSSIPLIGELFKYRNVSKAKRNLLNFIRPTILRGLGAANYYTSKKYDYLRNLQKEERKRGIPLLPGSQRPLVPSRQELDDHPDFKTQLPARSNNLETSVPRTEASDSKRPKADSTR